MVEQIPPPVPDSFGMRRAIGFLVGASAVAVSVALLSPRGEMLPVVAFIGLAGFLLGRWWSEWFGGSGLADRVMAGFAFWFCTVVSAALGGAFVVLLHGLLRGMALKDLGVALNGFLGGGAVGGLAPFMPFIEPFRMAGLFWWACLIAVEWAARRLRRRAEARRLGPAGAADPQNPA